MEHEKPGDCRAFCLCSERATLLLRQAFEALAITGCAGAALPASLPRHVALKRLLWRAEWLHDVAGADRQTVGQARLDGHAASGDQGRRGRASRLASVKPRPLERARHSQATIVSYSAAVIDVDVGTIRVQCCAHSCDRQRAVLFPALL